MEAVRLCDSYAARPSGRALYTNGPHIAKVFRFAPSSETTLHVRAFRPADFGDLDLAREDGYAEYACLAESVIADGEYRLWAGAESVAAYLREWIDWTPVAIADHAKLARHCGAS